MVPGSFTVVYAIFFSNQVSICNGKFNFLGLLKQDSSRFDPALVFKDGLSKTTS